MIAGEGIVGIILAVFAIFGISNAIDISGVLGLPDGVSNILSVVLFAITIFTVVKFSYLKKRNNAGK